MQVSLNWLNELVDLKDISVNQIAHELTMSGLEVEEIEEVKPQFTNIITAKIEKIDAHPNSDRLHLVTVNTGKDLRTVVCGGQNIAVGQVIPYASVGSKVLDRKTGEQFELTPAVIRGVESQGMLCSDDELGVADRNYQEEDGILILNRIFPNLGLGLNVEDVLGFEKDYILHTAPTANDTAPPFCTAGTAAPNTAHPMPTTMSNAPTARITDCILESSRITPFLLPYFSFDASPSLWLSVLSMKTSSFGRFMK